MQNYNNNNNYSNGGGVAMDKNPNGGYLNQNQYGFFGTVDVTPQLLQQIQQTGKVTVSVSEPQQRQSGGDTWVSSRCTLKPYTPKEAPRPQANNAMGYNSQAPAPQQAPAASVPPQQAPMQGQTSQGQNPFGGGNNGQNNIF